VATGVGAAQILPICRGVKGKRAIKSSALSGQIQESIDAGVPNAGWFAMKYLSPPMTAAMNAQGLATGPFERSVKQIYTVNRVYAIGSVEMMQAAAQMTQGKKIFLSGVTLNPYYGQWSGHVRVLQGQN